MNKEALEEYAQKLDIVLNKELEKTKAKSLPKEQMEKDTIYKMTLCQLLKDFYLATQNEEVKDLLLEATLHSKMLVRKLANEKGMKEKDFFDDDVGVSLNKEELEEKLKDEIEEQIKEIDTRSIKLKRQTIFDIFQQIREKISDGEQIFLDGCDYSAKKIFYKILEYAKTRAPKVVALIPARGGSKRIPKKNLYPIAGRPLLSWSIEACLQSSVDEVWVSSEDEEILSFCRNVHKVKVLKRPSRLATDTASTDDVIFHFAEKVDFDILVLVQSTSPLITWKDIDRGIEFVRSRIYDSVFSAVSAATHDILFWKVDGVAKPVNFDLENRGLSQTRDNPYYIETGAFYIVRKASLLRTKSRYGERIGPCEVPLYTIFEIDDFEDIPIVEYLIDFQNKVTG